MPTVPYRPYPTAEPAVEPTPRIGLSVPGAAFGTNIAEAVKGFGGALQQASNDVAQTTLRIAALQNDTWAKDADTNAMIKIGQLDSEFKQLEGQNAVDALPEHQKKIQDIRDDALADAPNAGAKRMLNNTLTRRVGFAVVDAGNYAGTQAKVALNNASSARLQAAQETFDPEHPETSEKTIASEIRHQSDVHGALPETHKENVQKAISKGYLNSISKLAPSDPQKARAIFENVKDRLDPQVRDALQNVVNRNMAIHGTRQIADDILSDYDPSKQGPGDLQTYLDKAKKVAQEHKDNPDFQDYLENRVRAQFNLGQAGYRDAQNGNKLKVELFAHGQDWNSKITSMDGIAGPNAPPEVRAAYNALDVKGKREVEAYVAKESKLSIPYTPERQARYWELQGMAEHDPEKYVQLDILNEDLPRGKIDSLMDKKKALLARSNPDSGLNKALGNANVQSTLHAAEIGPSRTDTEKSSQWNKFTGAMEEALNEFKAEHPGKAPNDKELREIAQSLLQKVVTSKGWLFDTKERRFEAEVPEEHQDAIKRQFRQVWDRDPTEAEVRAAYLAKQHFPSVQ
jgi:hypothetical protein